MTQPPDKPRLIERAFPLKQTSLDSVHEKNVRHGHISTLHIWPARRPLAACRAALIATLLPDPGTPEGRQELCEKIGGKVVKKIERKKMPDGRIVEREKEETEGGILHWKRETENVEELEWFRQEIRKAYGGRPPRVLDPFAGGGAIPLEAMRLGCEAIAADINPVAWFIQKCTLDYPQKLAGKTHPLPDFILDDEDFMEEFYKAHPHLVGRTKQTRKQLEKPQPDLWEKSDSGRIPKADIAWHVRAWGKWVQNQARRELAPFYPAYAEFEQLDNRLQKPFERMSIHLIPLKEDGTDDITALNSEFTEEYLNDKYNPRWIAKPTVAYLWARTVICKNCRASIPLLKTLWFCKKDKKRILLTMEANSEKSGVKFKIHREVPSKGGNAAQKREHDKRLSTGTMTRSGAQCPCCQTIMTMEDLRFEGKAGRLGVVPTAVVVDGLNSKEYRLPTELEIRVATNAKSAMDAVFQKLPFGSIVEPLPGKEALGFRVPLYGFDQWNKLFTDRQLFSLGTFVFFQRKLFTSELISSYPSDWREAIIAYLGACLSRLADRGSAVCSWTVGYDQIRNTFSRFALPMVWDFAELQPYADSSGGYGQAVEWVANALEHLLNAEAVSPQSMCLRESAITQKVENMDIIVTDPPYYDAIPYSDLMDFFYIWLRRALWGISPEFDEAFVNPLSPKWDDQKNNGELIDDASRFGGDKAASKKNYEDGMARAFLACNHALNKDGRLVIVFAHKHPDAWETLASAVIRSGFVVDGSWPIQTEQQARTRAMASAALASSVWLVCKKRPETARAGWDNIVMEEMRKNISERLREYWDAGIRGPDFVWAATGPAMEAYSKHPVVKKANEPGKIMEVGEFLNNVRRMVVDYIVGQVLTGEKGSDLAAAESMDAPTAYYLLHRHDFGLDEAPAGACILYATACGLTDHSLEVNWDILSHANGGSYGNDGDEDSDTENEAEGDSEVESGSKIKLKNWSQRKNKSMGYEAPGGRPVPLIDRVHRLMHLWNAGDVHKVDEYLDDNGLRRQELFKRLLQSLIELSLAGSEERACMECLSNHIQAAGAIADTGQGALGFNVE